MNMHNHQTVTELSVKIPVLRGNDPSVCCGGGHQTECGAFLGILQLGKHNFCTGVKGSNVQQVSICAIGNTLHFFHIVRCKLPGLFQVEFRKLPGFFPGYTLQFLEKGTVHPDGYANFFPALLTVGASSLIGRSLNCNFFHFHSIVLFSIS